VYEGNYLNNVQHGQGTFTWKIGDVYVGEYVGGKREGQGHCKWTTGWQYAGGWAGNGREGPGEIKTPDGVTYPGVSAANKMEVQFPSGRKYITEFAVGGIPKNIDGFNKAALLSDPDVSTIFAAMDVNNDGSVSKFEYMEFVREHKPKGFGTPEVAGTYTSLPELQSFFGFQNYHEITHAEFQRVFASHNLDPQLFGGDYADSPAVRAFMAPRELPSETTIVVSHHSAQMYMVTAVCAALEAAGFKLFHKNQIRGFESASVFDEYVDASTVCIPLLSTEYLTDTDCVAKLASMVTKDKKIVSVKVAEFEAAKAPSTVTKALKNMVPKSDGAVFGDNFDAYLKTLIAGIGAAGVNP
jgi:hypothetical protein